MTGQIKLGATLSSHPAAFAMVYGSVADGHPAGVFYCKKNDCGGDEIKQIHHIVFCFGVESGAEEGGASGRAWA
ncbi:hypothetical protein CPU03_04425 [Edwardsiella tarda]|uniref:Uncharacterized protein n=1 Tax=Edwardsiella tarda TaxID=636 RepID=A0A2A7U569_EDWTA|nr:hypothetical protein CPU03_04425 [Edwardsiella tarda]PEH73556.1 hypothetical protein CRM76_17285 [Edwardsiella tarda]BEH73474.1 hypothetical protein GBS0709_25910 [Edwardsiella tarda]